MPEPAVRFDSLGPRAQSSYVFADCRGEVRAQRPEEVAEALDEVERWAREGGHAAGFVTYEAAAGLEPAAAVDTRVHSLPLLWFGLFGDRVEVDALTGLDDRGDYELGPLKPSLSFDQYARAIDDIHAYIAAGDSYQVNFTQRLHGEFGGDARGLYATMCHNQRASHCALIELDGYAVLSASPELFFVMREGELLMRPMKGTCRRGRWLQEDEQMASALGVSSKDRAENVMIVDLIRNDLGRVSRLGSVGVEDLWELERYETVWQMTSAVRSRCRPDVGLSQLFAALFPCGSVTGAPKIRTMEIIAELEDTPRGIYTGAIGYVSPCTGGADERASTRAGVTGLAASFNVAIRTLVIDRSTGHAEAGIGGGITHYSNARGEYEESLLKASFLTRRRPDFELLETLLCSRDGYFLLERHLHRLRASAEYFGFRCSVEGVRDKLLARHSSLPEGDHRVRLTLSADGVATIESRPLDSASPAAHWQVEICDRAVDSDDVFLYHKTTNRQVYDERRSAYPHCRDVILCNERGEVTECCVGNLVLEIDGERCTPARSSGLLAGTYRDELLEEGTLHERVLDGADVRRAERLFMINSVRKWVPLTLGQAHTRSCVAAADIALSRVEGAVTR